MRESILEEAQRLIHGQRNKDYGHPRENITHTAELFSAYLGIEVTPLDVSALMILLKLSRVHGTGYHRDSIIDIAGYAGVAERVHEEEHQEEPDPDTENGKRDLDFTINPNLLNRNNRSSGQIPREAWIDKL